MHEQMKSSVIKTLLLYIQFSKLLLLAKVKKLQISADEGIRIKIMQRIFQFIKGETCQAVDSIRKELESEIKYLNEENTN